MDRTTSLAAWEGGGGRGGEREGDGRREREDGGGERGEEGGREGERDVKMEKK